jgi:hypothetical protein
MLVKPQEHAPYADSRRDASATAITHCVARHGRLGAILLTPVTRLDWFWRFLHPKIFNPSQYPLSSGMSGRSHGLRIACALVIAAASAATRPSVARVSYVLVVPQHGLGSVRRWAQPQLGLRGGADDEQPAWGAWLHDADEGSLTIAWVEDPGASAYEVQLRKEGAVEWASLSATLSGTMLRKKNLEAGTRYEARVRACSVGGTWGDFAPAVACATLPAGAPRMGAPAIVAEDNEGCILKWDAVPGAAEYRVELRHRSRALGGAPASPWEPLSKTVPAPSFPPAPRTRRPCAARRA